MPATRELVAPPPEQHTFQYTHKFPAQTRNLSAIYSCLNLTEITDNCISLEPKGKEIFMFYGCTNIKASLVFAK